MYLLLILPLLAATKIILQGRIIKQKSDCMYNMFIINGIVFILTALVIGIIFIRTIPAAETFLFSSLISVGTLMLQLGYACAFTRGSVSLASTINNFSMILPMLLGIILYDEKLSAANWIAVALLPVSFVLLSYKKGDNKKNLMWFVFTMIAFFGSGFSNSVMTVITHNNFNTTNEEILFYSYIISSVMCFIGAFFSQNTVVTTRIKLEKGIMFGFFGIALALGAYNVIWMYALTKIPTVIVYPVTNILRVFLIALFDFLILRQKFTTRQLVGIAISSISIGLFSI